MSHSADCLHIACFIKGCRHTYAHNVQNLRCPGVPVYNVLWFVLICEVLVAFRYRLDATLPFKPTPSSSSTNVMLQSFRPERSPYVWRCVREWRQVFPTLTTTRSSARAVHAREPALCFIRGGVIGMSHSARAVHVRVPGTLFLLAAHR